MMTKKDYIRAAVLIREQRYDDFKRDEIASLFADFFEDDNPRFLRHRFLDYINGTCGPSGGKVKP